MESGGSGAEEEQVMSEVHLCCPPHFSGIHVSRFSFSSRPLLGVSEENDGDGSGGSVLIAGTSGSVRSDYHLLTIQHGVTSSLKSVGLQVWKAALLLADFVLHKSFTSSNFDRVTAIEVGAGTGLVGLALARVAKRFFIITDRGTDILDNCLANVHINSSTLKFDEASLCTGTGPKILWHPPVDIYHPSDPSLRYLRSAHEIEEAVEATVLFAADVIYSDDLTDLFFDGVKKLMSTGAKKVLYLALEKRYNFSLDELDVVANGYTHFRSFFATQDEHGDGADRNKPGLVGKLIDLAEVPQYTREYERGKDLEIWEIVYSPEQKLQ